MSSESVLGGRSSREIVEDTGLASDGVSQDKLCEVACIIAIVVGGRCCEGAVVGAGVDVRDDAAANIANDNVDIVVSGRRYIDGDECAVAQDPDGINNHGMEMKRRAASTARSDGHVLRPTASVFRCTAHHRYFEALSVCPR
jgi:hypothetical protein